jgi:SAM-dependent methyltransferase
MSHRADPITPSPRSDDPNLDPRIVWEQVDRCLCGGSLRPAAVWGWGVCETCGTWGNTHRPAAESLAVVYGHTYWTTTQQMAGVPQLEQRFESDLNDRIGAYLGALLPHVPAGGRVAEVGCGNARLLHELRGRGFDAVGTEFSADVIARVNRLTDAPVRRGGAETLERAAYDAVVSIDVMEHAHDPRAFLREHLRALAPGGVMMIHTPVHESQAQVYGYSVGMLWKLYHLWLFSRPLFDRLVAEAGLVVVDRSTVLFGWPVVVLKRATGGSRDVDG